MISSMGLNGADVPTVDTEKMELLRKAAEEGDADAQFRLAIKYFVGTGVPKEKIEAAEWCRKAAEQSHGGAQSRLGACYSAGHGVPKDDAEALKWWRKAAERAAVRRCLGGAALFAVGE